MPKLRCTGKTREGKRCKLPPMKDSTRCATHGQVSRTYLNALRVTTNKQKTLSRRQKARSNIGKQHQFLKPLPCTITSLLKRSKRNKIYIFRRAKSSGIRYKQYC